jgi:group II intron reverse transcriptase/maturase
VSADEAMTIQDKVRDLQRALYRTAKAEPGRRFHALYDKIYRSDVMEQAWVQVRRNRGVAGIDRITLDAIEQYGVPRMLDGLISNLKEGEYRPLPSRRVYIPKPGGREHRPLSIPTVRDRVVQTAMKTVLEPIFEADFAPSSFGFRPKRRAHDALQVLLDESFRGKRWVVESDIANCFEAIPHDRLMFAVGERICDQKVLRLVRSLLRAGVLEDGSVKHTVTGTPQGGGLSPLLCNIYLNWFDQGWKDGRSGTVVRYVDDLVVVCRTEREAKGALVRMTDLLSELGLGPKAEKTRIVHLEVGGEGFDFLGFHHRLVCARGPAAARQVIFLARWPSRRAMDQARGRIRELTSRSRLLVPIDKVVKDVNTYMVGWAGYFRYGNSAQALDDLSGFARERMIRFAAAVHRRSRAYGTFLLKASGNDLGLTNLHGAGVAPRPLRGWRGLPNAAGEGRR